MENNCRNSIQRKSGHFCDWSMVEANGQIAADGIEDMNESDDEEEVNNGAGNDDAFYDLV
jgi:hypothetical protein